MLPIAEALETIFADLLPLPAERVSLLAARGRVLAEDVSAPRDLPPRDNSAMDGYALRHRDLGPEGGELRVTESIPAGGQGRRELGAGEAAKIMTGAPVPPGADTVVPVEDTRAEGDRVRVRAVPQPGANIRSAGEDVRAGQLVMPRGTWVRPAEVGMLASLGRSFVAVYQRPRVAVLATGDEVVEIDAPTEGGRIVNSNSYGVAAQVSEAGGVPVILGIGRDDPEGLLEMLERGLGADAVITTGGVSMGDYDYVRPVLERAGVEVRFWKVAMKPGKPFVYGRRGRVPVFGLPGNPVSAMVVFEEFVRPALRVMQGNPRPYRPVLEAELLGEAGPLRTRPGRMDFVRCRVERRGTELVVVSLKSQGSGILRTLVEANALLVVPAGADGASAGERVQVQLYDTSFLDGVDPGLPGMTAAPPEGRGGRTMRDFNDADRKKKRGRIELPANPGNLSEEALTRLGAAVQGAVKDGYVPCPSAWRLAKEEGVPRLDVGVMIDRLGIRVTNCQLGCFKVEKTASAGDELQPPAEETARRVDALAERGELTCPNVFAVARELDLKPLVVADAANARGHKLGGCQLGCF